MSLLVVSHVWESVEHPDPTGAQLRLIAQTHRRHYFDVIFYDFSSLAQYVREMEWERQ